MKRNRNRLAAGLIISSAIVTMAGCAGTQKAAAPEAQSAPARIEPAQTVLAGKVVETMNAGSYSYVLLEKDGKKVWAAIPVLPSIKVGDDLELLPGAEMKNFTSQSLKRTFDSVFFSGGPVSKGVPTPAGKPAAMPSGHSGMKPKGAPAAPASEIKPSSIVLSGKVVETKNVGSYTYILLEKEGKKGWSAVPTAAAVKVGDDIEILPGLEMGLFTSPSTKETYENIYFSSGIKGPAPTSAAPAVQPGGVPAGHPALPK